MQICRLRAETERNPLVINGVAGAGRRSAGVRDTRFGGIVLYLVPVHQAAGLLPFALPLGSRLAFKACEKARKCTETRP